MPIIAANWKMNKTSADAVSFIARIRAAVIGERREVIIAPPATLLHSVAEAMKGSVLKLAAQNMHWAEKGAFTGEISPLQVKDVGATHVIIGHSERRILFGETGELIAKKLAAAVAHGLRPIFCVGETREQREAAKTFAVIEAQLREGLSLLKPAETGTVVFAYEPVWAIGTGVTATSEQAEEVHQFIDEYARKNCLQNSKNNVTILYGGSVTPDNIDSLMGMPHIEGVLVGGASLNEESFLRIINFKEI